MARCESRAKERRYDARVGLDGVSCIEPGICPGSDPFL